MKGASIGRFQTDPVGWKRILKCLEMVHADHYSEFCQCAHPIGFNGLKYVPPEVELKLFIFQFK